MEKRFITITQEQKKELDRGYRRGKPHVRNRCRAILLSAKGYDIDSLVDVFGVNRQTIYRWFNHYEKNGIEGLENQGKGGRTPILDINNEKTVKYVKEIVEQEPQNLNKILSTLEQELDIKLSRRTLTRFLKKLISDGNDLEKA